MMEGVNIPSSNLPPGFRFHPTDQELIIHYLKKKVSSSPTPVISLIADIDLYKFNPWELPDKACFGEEEWFFFSPRARKYPNGDRPNRAAGSGYWKATGTDRPILTSSGSQCLGVKKALVFYTGRPPKGMKTDWLMHEYRLLDDAGRSPKLKGSMRLDDWVLCRVRLKSHSPPHMPDRSHESLCSGSPPFSYQSLEEQMMVRRNGLLDGTDNQYKALFMGSPEGDTAISSYTSQNICLQESPTLSSASNMASSNSTQAPLVFHQVLESIKRTLSITGMDEFVTVPPSKLVSSSTNNMHDNMSMEVEEYSLVDSTSGTRCFSDFLI